MRLPHNFWFLHPPAGFLPASKKAREQESTRMTGCYADKGEKRRQVQTTETQQPQADRLLCWKDPTSRQDTAGFGPWGACHRPPILPNGGGATGGQHQPLTHQPCMSSSQAQLRFRANDAGCRPLEPGTHATLLALVACKCGLFACRACRRVRNQQATGQVAPVRSSGLETTLTSRPQDLHRFPRLGSSMGVSGQVAAELGSPLQRLGGSPQGV